MNISAEPANMQLTGRGRATIYSGLQNKPIDCFSFRLLVGLSFWSYLAVYSTGFLHGMLGILSVPIILLIFRGRGIGGVKARYFLQLFSLLVLLVIVWQRSGPMPGIVLLLQFTGIILFLQLLVMDCLRAVYGVMILSLMMILGVAAMNVNFLFPLILTPYIFNFYLVFNWISLFRHECATSLKVSVRGRITNFKSYVADYAISVGIFAFLWLVIFYLIPRTESFGLASEASKRRLQGFSDTLSLGETGLLEDNPAVVMRIKPVEEKTLSPSIIRRLRARLLRGTTFAKYSNGKWGKIRRRSWFADLRRNSGEMELLAGAINPRDLHQLEIILENTEPPIIFVPDQTREISLGLPFVGVADDQTLHFVNRVSGSRKYFANILLNPMNIQDSNVSEIIPGRDTSSYLTLEGIPERVKVLAASIASGTETVAERVAVAMAFLERNCRYSLEQFYSGKIDPVEDFLFEGRSGSCEHFATALTLLVRAMGIPARPVSGYLMGDWNDVGKFYTVRQGDAHTWVEVYFPVFGWAPFDPTPAALERGPESKLDKMLLALWETYEGYWFSYVYNFDNRSQSLGFKKIFTAMAARLDFITGLRLHKELLFLLLLAAAIFGKRLKLFVRNLVKPSSWIPMCYLEWEAKLPVSRRVSETPAEFHQRLLAEERIPAEVCDKLKIVTELIDEAAFCSRADYKACKDKIAALLGEIKL